MSASLYFELETGKMRVSTKNASLHIADGHLHFWHGPFMYSVYLGDMNIGSLCQFMYGWLDGNGDGWDQCESLAGMKFYYEKIDDEQCLITIDEIDTRFMFSINPLHIKALASFLFSNDHSHDKNFKGLIEQ